MEKICIGSIPHPHKRFNFYAIKTLKVLNQNFRLKINILGMKNVPFVEDILCGTIGCVSVDAEKYMSTQHRNWIIFHKW